MTCALGIDLGGSSVKAVTVTPEGGLRRETNVAFDANEHFDWAPTIQKIVQDTRESLAAQSRQESEGGECDSLAIGISAPGLAAADGRSIAYMPGRLHGLEGLDWTEFLAKLDGPETTPQNDESGKGAPLRRQRAIIPVVNDAHAALLGEAWLGAARGFRHVVMLTLGTGVGGAALVDGKLLRGAVGRGGHFGHASLNPDGPRDVCNMPGSVETVIGNYNIVERTQGRFSTTHALVAAHLAGDEKATRLWLDSVRRLACGIASFINIIDPEAVIIGGGIARAGAALFEPLERFVRDVEWHVTKEPVKIIPAQLGELAGAYGAAWNALESH